MRWPRSHGEDSLAQPVRTITTSPTPAPEDLRSAQLFRSLMRSSTDGLWICDEAGRTVMANDRLAEILGRSTEEVSGLAVADVLDAGGLEDLVGHLDELTRGQSGRDNVECNLVRKDGSRTWALVSWSPMLDDDGVRQGWLYRVAEVTDRKLILDVAVAGEQHLADAQSTARVGSWEWDIPHDVVSWSDELYRIYDVHPQAFEATYEGFLTFVHPDDRAMVEAVVASAFTQPDPFEFEARIIKASGSEGWMRGRGRASRDQNGVPIRMSGTAQEITESVLAAAELAAARDAAVEASRIKSEFLANISHEIRTPLNGVIGLTGLLLRTELTSTQARLADAVAQSGRTLLGLVNDILDFSRIEGGDLDLEVEDVVIRDLLEQVVRPQADAARVRSVKVSVHYEEDVPHVLRGDSVRFRQVVTNLVANAVKFTHAGHVQLRVSLDDGPADRHVVRVEVCDTGIGIAPEAQATLFESFTQADASSTREYGGTGLGLAISRLLVGALGGQIGFTSEVGVGSTFWFTATFLPSADGARPVPEVVLAPWTPDPDEGPDEGSDGGSEASSRDASLGAVLVADDNVFNQMVARGVLEGLGYTVEFAQDGLEAVAAVAATPGHFAAVLMDCQMPQLDGYEATRVIRQLEQPDLRVPVIAMTASTLAGERERCLAAGMDDFLLKPVDFELLESTLARRVRGEAPPEDDGPHADASGLLDLARIRMLRDLRPGEQSFFDQFVNTFVAGVPDDLAAIASAILVTDHGRLVEAAHSLKGSALNLGAVEVGRLCEALEDAGGRQDAFAASDLLPGLEDVVERTLHALGNLADDPA
ncbi:MAG: ATP-binding protein [Marmoricola sp.]